MIDRKIENLKSNVTFDFQFFGLIACHTVMSHLNTNCALFLKLTENNFIVAGFGFVRRWDL